MRQTSLTWSHCERASSEARTSSLDGHVQSIHLWRFSDLWSTNWIVQIPGYCCTLCWVCYNYFAEKKWIKLIIIEILWNIAFGSRACGLYVTYCNVNCMALGEGDTLKIERVTDRSILVINICISYSKDDHAVPKLDDTKLLPNYTPKSVKTTCIIYTKLQHDLVS